MTHEKCIRQLPTIRISETLETTLMRMSARDDGESTDFGALHCGAGDVGGEGKVNRYSSTKDTTMQRTPTGGGHASLFHCMACAKHKPQQGRRMQRVHGLRTWVCAGCAK